MGDYVIVALTSDEGIRLHKGYDPELDYAARAEVLSGLRYVDEVVPCNWLIDEAFLDRHKVDILLHGDDNPHPIPSHRLVIVPRIEGISSSLIRTRVQRAFRQIAGDSDDE